MALARHWRLRTQGAAAPAAIRWVLVARSEPGLAETSALLELGRDDTVILVTADLGNSGRLGTALAEVNDTMTLRQTSARPAPKTRIDTVILASKSNLLAPSAGPNSTIEEA